MATPTAAMLVIGDEILSGRTQDVNMHHLAGVLTARGIRLAEARVVADDHAAILTAVQALSTANDMLFTSGGIGPTHDDITADAVADALGAGIDVRADARALLEANYARTGAELNAARLRMARIPDGAALIENPVSAAPGFTLGNVHVMAGVPKVFAAMLDALLPRLAAGTPLGVREMRVDRPEGEIAGPLAELAAAFPDLSFGSYPYRQDGRAGAQLVVRGQDGGRLDAAMAGLAEAFPGAG